MKVAIIGATGAVGGEALRTLLSMDKVEKVSTFGRRTVQHIKDSRVDQHIIDIFEPSTYAGKLDGHHVAICTLGVGEPSKIKREDFIKIDKDAVLEFAKKCKAEGVAHFQLLSSVGANSNSRNWYLKTKGELVEELQKLQFSRLSIFKPSMILTPTNRYGFSQAIALRIWPALNLLFHGSFKKYRGIKMEQLGEAIAKNTIADGTSFEELHWQEFRNLCE